MAEQTRRPIWTGGHHLTAWPRRLRCLLRNHVGKTLYDWGDFRVCGACGKTSLSRNRSESIDA